MIIRNVREEEWGEFMRLLEVSYGFPSGFFPRYYPYLYGEGCRDYSSFYVVEDGGRLVSHVGLFKMNVVSLGVRLTIGGIGGVATLPSERGRGYMSMLLNHVIGVMRRSGIPLSVLWGDRQRYGAFSWEVAGQKYSLYVTERSVGRSGVKPLELVMAQWDDALPTMAMHYESIPIRVERNWECYRGFQSLDPAALGNPPMRVWVSEHGYLISQGEGDVKDPLGRPNVVEVASLKGLEAELVSGFMRASGVRRVIIHVNAHDEGRLSRLLRIASYYMELPEGVFRIINLSLLLKAFTRLLSDRAQGVGLRDYEVTLGLRFNDYVDKATLFVRGGVVDISPNEASGNYVEVDERDGVRLILGGPMGPVPKPLKPLMTLLPIPIHVPLLNYV